MHRAICLGVLIASVPAAAEPPGLAPTSAPTPAAPADREPDREAYRAEVFAVDSVSALALVASPPTAILGLGTYVLGAPIIHARHGHTGRAVGSLAMRLGIPAALGYLASRNVGDDDEAFLAVGMGILGGMLLASTIDIAFVAGADDSPRPQPRIAPTMARTREGTTTFGFAGSF